MGREISTRNGISALEEPDERQVRALNVAREAIDAAHAKIGRSVNAAMVEAYWVIGKEIADATGERAEYGAKLISYLSKKLTAEYGKGYSHTNLRSMRQFYRTFPIHQTLSGELGWSHYVEIMRVTNPEARCFYVGECARSNWGVRELRRQIDTHLFERLLHTQEAEVLKNLPDAERASAALEHVDKDSSEIDSAMSPFKDPYVLDFLDMPKR